MNKKEVEKALKEKHTMSKKEHTIWCILGLFSCTSFIIYAFFDMIVH